MIKIFLGLFSLVLSRMMHMPPEMINDIRNGQRVSSWKSGKNWALVHPENRHENKNVDSIVDQVKNSDLFTPQDLSLLANKLGFFWDIL